MKKKLLFIAMIALGLGLNAQVVTFEDDFESYADSVNLSDAGYDVWVGEALVVDTDIQTQEEAAYGGKNFAKCTPSGNDFYLRKSVTLEVGKTYTFDVHTRGTKNHRIAVKLGADSPTLGDLMNSATWVRSTITFTVASGQTDAIIWVYSYPNNRVDVDDFRLYEGVATGIKDVEVLDANVYPNPLTTGSDLYVQLNETTNDPAKIEIININGQVIYSMEHANSGNSVVRVGIQELSLQGIYLLRVTAGNKATVKKIIVK